MIAVNASNAVICTLCCDNKTKKSNLIVIAFYFVKKGQHHTMTKKSLLSWLQVDSTLVFTKMKLNLLIGSNGR